MTITTPPRHHGPLAAATVSMPGRTPGCGDEITIYLQVDKTGTHVGCVQFEGTGCTVSQALASLLTERVQGMSLHELAALHLEELFPDLERGIVQSRVRCAALALNTLKAAIAVYGQRQNRQAS
ncbi:MAG: iron-sulfur cluster assembly scaffold protein [Chloroflexaceae bacterium]|nr:iron-sulfur cluster assembly scaffold protein [Chloroflexaceae bacterium]